LHNLLIQIFTRATLASAGISCRLSVCLSQVGVTAFEVSYKNALYKSTVIIRILLKWLNVGSHKQCSVNSAGTVDFW